MGGRWNHVGFRFLYVFVFAVGIQIQGAWSLNSEGLALLEFRARVNSDPNGAFANWNQNDSNPCSWSGVCCLEGKVHMLDMTELRLEGTLSPELRKLRDVRSLVLLKNRFSGAIPKEFGDLRNLELMDLRNNKLSGRITVEIGSMLSLKRLMLHNNKFEGSTRVELERLNLLPKLQFDENHTFALATRIRCVNRKLGHCFFHSSLKQKSKGESFIIPIKGVLIHYLRVLALPLFKSGKGFTNTNRENCCGNLPSSSDSRGFKRIERLVKFARRKLLEQSSNLQAPPASGNPSTTPTSALPTVRSSGSFPAVPNAKKKQYPVIQPPSPNNSQPSESKPSKGHSSLWNYLYIIPGVAALLIIAAALFFMCRSPAARTIGPWKTGLSGQLQKAFVTGVPKLNRQELETACEDFSNIIDNLLGCTIYKGTLSSGVEIAVAISTISSSKEWAKNSEMAYRKKIDTLSRINHKNFVNLIGYCDDDEPFNRMMVFEYAPNGTLFEHLHVKEMEHLDWNARVRIIMGTAYCLQYMHELNPPIAHSNLISSCIYLTDDYAAKVAEICFSAMSVPKSKGSSDDDVEHSLLPPLADLETNIHSFGILLLEIISGKLPHSDEQGSLEKWAAQYLSDPRSISYMIDPSLKSFKNNELDLICEVIQECIHSDPRQRPTMKDIISKLREVINLSPDQATPRLSPLWWAELEILSVEAT